MDNLCSLCLAFAILSCLFIVALWSSAGKGLTSWLSFVMFNCFCHFPMRYPGLGVVLDCIDSRSLSPFSFCNYAIKTSISAKK